MRFESSAAALGTGPPSAKSALTAAGPAPADSPCATLTRDGRTDLVHLHSRRCVHPLRDLVLYDPPPPAATPPPH